MARLRHIRKTPKNRKLGIQLQCQICKRCFASSGGLTRHVEDWKGHNRVTKAALTKTQKPQVLEGLPPELAALPSTYHVIQSEGSDIQGGDESSSREKGNEDYFSNIGSWYAPSIGSDIQADEIEADKIDVSRDNGDEGSSRKTEDDFSDTGSWYAPSTSEEDEHEDVDDVLDINSDIEDDDMLGYIAHPHGGYLYQNAQDKQENATEIPDQYYPWQNATELWLCDLLFRRGHLSIAVADEILGAISSGKLSSTEPVRFKNSREMHQLMDKVAIDMPFYTQTWDITYNHESWTGKKTLWYRDPLDVIGKLFCNPLFGDKMAFVPEKHTDPQGNRRYSEIHWSDFWWNLQDSGDIPEGATIVPVLLAIDETHLNIIGRTKVHPVYLTIGNIPKRERRTYSKHAYVVIAYLPALEGSGSEQKTPIYAEAKNRLYHTSLSHLLESIKDASIHGRMMKGPDGMYRNCFPVIMSIAADYPEACHIGLVRQGSNCLVCMAKKKDFPNLVKKHKLRTVPAMKKVLDTAHKAIANGRNVEGELELQKNGLIDMQNSLWDLPHVNMYNIFTPDVLHQIKKGVWEHIITWFKHLVHSRYSAQHKARGILAEFDARISLVPHFPGLRRFPNGITQLPQMTAGEYSATMKIFLACARGFFPSNLGVLECVRAFLTWYFHASLPVQTDATLKELEKDLKVFNNAKKVFVDVSPSKFQFPKFHSMQHYAAQIKLYGTLDNYDSEYGEHQHITDAKEPYRRSNKRDPKAQMIHHIQRRTGLESKLDYIAAQNVLGDQGQNSQNRNQQGMGSRVLGMMSIQDANQEFKLRGVFERATGAFFDDLECNAEVLDICNLQITIYQSYTIFRADPYRESDDETIKNIIRCNRKFYNRPRYDWVVIWNTEKLEKAHQKGVELYGMDQYKIGQLQLLFAINHDGSKRHLAYIEWFNIGIPDTETKMPVTTRSGKFDVIEASTIVRSIHLIPFFKDWNSARTGREQNKDVYAYDKYLVNSYSDIEAWETFYL